MLKFIAGAGLLLLSSATIAQQACRSIPENTVVDDFTLNDDGTVVHNTTGLMWQRCPYGQTWDNENKMCTGSAAQLIWTEAIIAANNYELAGHDDWRVPNMKELGSIVERMCVEPSLNTEVFPNSPDENFWTSTTVSNEVDRAWSIAFYNGKNNTKSKVVDLYIRFVRFSQ